MFWHIWALRAAPGDHQGSHWRPKSTPEQPTGAQGSPRALLLGPLVPSRVYVGAILGLCSPTASTESPRSIRNSTLGSPGAFQGPCRCHVEPPGAFPNLCSSTKQQAAINSQQATRRNQQTTSNTQQATSNKNQATHIKQQAANNTQQATSNQPWALLASALATGAGGRGVAVRLYLSKLFFFALLVKSDSNNNTNKNINIGL